MSECVETKMKKDVVKSNKRRCVRGSGFIRTANERTNPTYKVVVTFLISTWRKNTNTETNDEQNVLVTFLISTRVNLDLLNRQGQS